MSPEPAWDCTCHMCDAPDAEMSLMLAKMSESVVGDRDDKSASSVMSPEVAGTLM